MLEFRLKAQPSLPIDVFGLAPNQIAGLNLAEIQSTDVYAGNQSMPISGLFEISGDPSSEQQRWVGDFSKVNGIGSGMGSGWVQVEGNCGNYAGAKMRGGTMQVSGNVGSFCGASMTDGIIHVRGDTDSCLGANLAGEKYGQNGGAILVDGSATSLVGQKMRRGLIAVGGDVKNCCGLMMKAGTIIVFGMARKNVGLEMVRGTILLMNNPKVESAGFVSAGRHELGVQRLLNNYLANLGFSKSIPNAGFELFHGDPLTGNRGEIFVA